MIKKNLFTPSPITMSHPNGLTDLRWTCVVKGKSTLIRLMTYTAASRNRDFLSRSFASSLSRKGIESYDLWKQCKIKRQGEICEERAQISQFHKRHVGETKNPAFSSPALAKNHKNPDRHYALDRCSHT